MDIVANQFALFVSQLFLLGRLIFGRLFLFLEFGLLFQQVVCILFGLVVSKIPSASNTGENETA